MKRLLIITLLTFFIGGAGWILYVGWKTRSAPHIAVTGGRPLTIRLPIAGPHFMQNDPRWAAEKIGGSGESIRGVGCTLCSVATAAQALGEKTDPATLNRTLIQTQGYTAQGWLVWSAVAQAFDKRLTVTVLNQPTHEALDRALEKGQYSLVKFILPMGIPHWVIVVGKDGLDYLVHDPLLATPEPVPLSERASAIYSVRIVSRGAI